VRPPERAPNYQLVAAWSGFLPFIGGAFAVGVAIHNEAIAQQRVSLRCGNITSRHNSALFCAASIPPSMRPFVVALEHTWIILAALT
jgi:hypothetical protein